jgi:hypothetical protein
MLNLITSEAKFFALTAHEARKVAPERKGGGQATHGKNRCVVGLVQADSRGVPT